MATLSNNSQQCPFWSEENRRCSIRRNGLFIPLQSHIASYCKSPNYRGCSLYQTEIAHVEAEQAGNPFNRRKYRRSPSKQTVQLRYFDDDGHCYQGSPKLADTINLSAGGMQISTLEPLLDETIIHFSFRKSASSKNRKGLARVTWCRYEEAAMKYKAGLSFHTSSYRGAARKQGKTQD